MPVSQSPQAQTRGRLKVGWTAGKPGADGTGPHWGMTDDRRDALPVVPSLSVRQGDTPDRGPAAQGPAPADLAERPAPPVPTPSGEGLNAAEVARLTGGGDEASGADRDLNRAEGVDPDSTES